MDIVNKHPRQNQLLAALSPEEWQRWQPLLDAVELPLGKVLHAPGRKITQVFFPTTAIVSLMYVMEDGASAEIAAVGHEGVVGVSVLMGGQSTTSSAVVQSAGQGFQLSADRMMSEFDRGGPVQHRLLRYTQALFTQMSQNAACNRHHSVEQQLCGCLLRDLDRGASKQELVTTQELIAGRLGVRREGITEAAGRLQGAGLIKYRRGHITVLDRARLETRSCECYAAVKVEYERLLPMACAA